MRYLPEPALPPRDQVTEDYWYRYTRNVEEEERRIKANQVGKQAGQMLAVAHDELKQ